MSPNVEIALVLEAIWLHRIYVQPVGLCDNKMLKVCVICERALYGMLNARWWVERSDDPHCEVGTNRRPSTTHRTMRASLNEFALIDDENKTERRSVCSTPKLTKACLGAAPMVLTYSEQKTDKHMTPSHNIT